MGPKIFFGKLIGPPPDLVTNDSMPPPCGHITVPQGIAIPQSLSLLLFCELSGTTSPEKPASGLPVNLYQSFSVSMLHKVLWLLQDVKWSNQSKAIFLFIL
jgi:hypothetical protein